MGQEKTLKGFCEECVEGASLHVSTHRPTVDLRNCVREEVEYVVTAQSSNFRVTARVTISALCHAVLTRFLLRAIVE